MSEVDPVDGVIADIEESYDPHKTGTCKFSDVLAFMEAHDYLNADKAACVEVLEGFREGDSIDYAKAMRKLI